jgi:biotin carboxylase
VTLLLLVCLAADPSSCRTEPIDFAGTQIECALYGQQAAAEWLAQHPKWRLAKWRCGPTAREV